MEGSDDNAEEDCGACASRFMPNAREKRLPPMSGASETVPQFSLKCAVESCVSGAVFSKDVIGVTKSEPFDCDCWK